MIKLYIKTFGCQMNEYDSYIISNLLKKHYNIIEVYNINNADILILNTCSVREKAKQKVLSELGLWNKIKIENGCIICLGGCVSSLEGKEIFNKYPFIDIIFGPQSLYKLPYMVNSVINTGKRVIDISLNNSKKFDYVFESDNVKDISSSLTIIEGCNKYCTYCVVPYSRGVENSRFFNSVISEVYTLAMQGVKEITFLGQNVSSYCGKISDKKYADLSLLLSYVNAINDIKRIKFISSHPLDFTTSIFKAYENNIKLADHLHLPIQSGSNEILRRMGRNYNINVYKYIINRLRKIRPNITFSTDIIVGFPGEQCKDFYDTINLIKEIKFDMSFVYYYSPRPNTKSFIIKDNIQLDEKKKRLSFLNNLLLQQSNVITDNMINSIQRVLIYKKDKNNNLIGKTDNNRIVIIKDNINYLGFMVYVHIKKRIGLNLVGNLIKKM